MRQLTTLLSLCFSTFFVFSLNAQIGCPGCVVNLPADLPADTLLLQDLPDGQKGVAYNQDISFRMPKTTTPVNAIDSITPPGLPISQIEILSIEGVPPGLFWQPNQTIFQTANQTDGCVKFCGTPTQSDSFVMTVKIKATVFFITQEATFPLRIYIAPEVSITEGFTMTDFTGCGSTTVTFTNNVPSGGNPGFSYQWDFGDGTTFEGENPPPHSYDEPGVYPVNYYAKIDTSPFVLASVKVLSVGCSDALNNPDLYFLVFNPSGEKIFDSSPHVNNTPLPYTWPVNLILDTTLTYTIAVWDEDSGLKGTDDPCGEVTFTVNNGGDTLTSGPLRLIVTILHDVKEVFSTDTVYVYPQPAPPTILAPNGLSECVGANTLLLLSSSGVGNQWWLDELPIPNETSFLHNPKQTGYYQVSVTTPDGCSAFSDSVLVEIYPLPDSPLYINVNNSLRLVDTSALPAQYALQWYNGNAPIPGETGFRYCATQSGNYGLLVTDLATGCMSFYSSTVMYDPSFDCTVSAGEVAALVLGLLPNPAAEQVQVRWGKPLSNGGSLRLWDAAGRLVKTMPLADGANAHSFDCGDVNVGYYMVEIVTEGFRGIGKLAVMR